MSTVLYVRIGADSKDFAPSLRDTFPGMTVRTILSRDHALRVLGEETFYRVCISGSILSQQAAVEALSTQPRIERKRARA